MPVEDGGICGFRKGTRNGRPRYCHKPLKVRSGPGFGYNIDKNGTTWIQGYCKDHGNLQAPLPEIKEANRRGVPYTFKVRGPWGMKRGSFDLQLRGLGWEDDDAEHGG